MILFLFDNLIVVFPWNYVSQMFIIYLFIFISFDPNILILFSRSSFFVNILFLTLYALCYILLKQRYFLRLILCLSLPWWKKGIFLIAVIRLIIFDGVGGHDNLLRTEFGDHRRFFISDFIRWSCRCYFFHLS